MAESHSLLIVCIVSLVIFCIVGLYIVYGAPYFESRRNKCVDEEKPTIAPSKHSSQVYKSKPGKNAMDVKSSTTQPNSSTNFDTVNNIVLLSNLSGPDQIQSCHQNEDRSHTVITTSPTSHYSSCNSSGKSGYSGISTSSSDSGNTSVSDAGTSCSFD